MGSGASAAPGQPSFQPEIEKKHSELEIKQGDLERSFEGLKSDLNTKLKEILAAEGKRIEALIEQRAQVLSEKRATRRRARRLEQARELASMNELLSFRQELDQVATSAAHARQELREEFKASLESATAASHKQVSDLGARGKAAEEKQAKLHESLRADLVAALQRCDSLQAAIDGLEREQETVKVVTEQATAILLADNLDEVQALLEEFRRDPGKELLANDAARYGKAVEKVKVALKDPATARLDLLDCKLGGDDLPVLLPALRDLPALKEVGLGHNRVGDSGATGLAEAVCHVPRLEMLGLFESQIGDGGAEALAKALIDGSAPALSCADFADGETGDEGKLALWEAQRARSIKEFSF